MQTSENFNVPSIIRITKMHGNGNDFIIIDELNETLIPEDKKPDFVKIIAHRKLGVGADGVIFVQKSRLSDAKFRYFNSDGSEAEMCGNGIRCLARYLAEKLKFSKNAFNIETKAGIVKVEVKNEYTRVKLGKPRLSWTEIPASKSNSIPWSKEINVCSRNFKIYALRLGVPHAVVIVDDFNFNLKNVGRKIRFDKQNFPEGTNVNFVKIISKDIVFVKTYERGVEDLTLSCGTGCGATVYLLNRLNITSNYVKVLTDGGELYIEIKDDFVYLEGQVRKVFDGNLNVNEILKDLELVK